MRMSPKFSERTGYSHLEPLCYPVQDLSYGLSRSRLSSTGLTVSGYKNGHVRPRSSEPWLNSAVVRHVISRDAKQIRYRYANKSVAVRLRLDH